MRTSVLIGELTTNDKGTIAESEIQTAALKAGLAVYKPVSGHLRADLIFEKAMGSGGSRSGVALAAPATLLSNPDLGVLRHGSDPAPADAAPEQSARMY